MKRFFPLLAVVLTLAACNQPNTTPTPSGNEVTGISLVDVQAGAALETVSEGATVDLAALGLREVAFRADTAATLSRVELTLDGETHVDETAPYTLPALDTSDWRLASGPHTVSVQPYGAGGAAGTPLRISFSVTAPNYQRYLYVFRPAAIDVFDIDQNHKRVKSLKLPGGIERIWGATAHAESHMLYISYHGRDAAKRFETGLLAYDLVAERVVWKKLYEPFVDSPAITRDGKTIYLSSGEATDRGTFWFVINAADGTVKDTIEVHRGAHNTIIGLGGKSVYLGSVRYPYLVVADTATNDVVKQIGPFRDGVRPFTVNGKETLAFVNVNRFLGFEVGDVATGKVLYSVQVKGFQEGPFKSELAVQSHGVALSPDEQEVWVVDSKNRYVHLYDVTGLPGQAPRYLESVKLPSPPNWVQFSRDGRFAYTSGGEVIDTARRQVIGSTSSAKVRIQIDFLDALPARAYVRYGLGYVTK